MKRFKNLPLIGGFIVLVLSVIVSSVQIGTKGQLTTGSIQAQYAQSLLSLQYTAPDLITVLVTSQKTIAGVDVVIGFDNKKIQILPSTLTSGAHMTTSGAHIDEATSVFRFSALPLDNTVTNGIVGQFRIAPLTDENSLSTTLTILNGPDQSGVFESNTITNILSNTSPLTFTIRK